MGVSHILADAKTVSVEALGGEAQQAARRQYARGGGHHRVEIADINEDIGGDRKIGASGRFAGQKFDKVGGGESIVDVFRARLLDHRR